MTSCGNGGVLALLPWANNNNVTVWKLISLLEEPESLRKLFGGKIPNFCSELNELAGWLNGGTKRKSQKKLID